MSQYISQFNETTFDLTSFPIKDDNIFQIENNELVLKIGNIDHNLLGNLSTGDPHSQYLLKSGGTLTGDIDMQNNSIANILVNTGSVDSSVLSNKIDLVDNISIGLSSNKIFVKSVNASDIINRLDLIDNNSITLNGNDKFEINGSFLTNPLSTDLNLDNNSITNVKNISAKSLANIIFKTDNHQFKINEANDEYNFSLSGISRLIINDNGISTFKHTSDQALKILRNGTSGGNIIEFSNLSNVLGELEFTSPDKFRISKSGNSVFEINDADTVLFNKGLIQTIDSSTINIASKLNINNPGSTAVDLNLNGKAQMDNLDVFSNLKVIENGGTMLLRFISASGRNFIQSAADEVTGSAADLVFTSFNNGSEHMRITANGNIGINQAFPQERLHIEGNLRVDGIGDFDGLEVTNDHMLIQNTASANIAALRIWGPTDGNELNNTLPMVNYCYKSSNDLPDRCWSTFVNTKLSKWSPPMQFSFHTKNSFPDRDDVDDNVKFQIDTNSNIHAFGNILHDDNSTNLTLCQNTNVGNSVGCVEIGNQVNLFADNNGFQFFTGSNSEGGVGSVIFLINSSNVECRRRFVMDENRQITFKRQDGAQAVSMGINSRHEFVIGNSSGNRGIILSTNSTSSLNGIIFKDINGGTEYFNSNKNLSILRSTECQFSTLNFYGIQSVIKNAIVNFRQGSTITNSDHTFSAYIIDDHFVHINVTRNKSVDNPLWGSTWNNSNIELTALPWNIEQTSVVMHVRNDQDQIQMPLQCCFEDNGTIVINRLEGDLGMMLKPFDKTYRLRCGFSFVGIKK